MLKKKCPQTLQFPSPLGVIFFLIFISLHYSSISFPVSVSSRSYILSYANKGQTAESLMRQFPSPLGVIFFLILQVLKHYQHQLDVSVSSRSYILSYCIESKNTVNERVTGLSVSSRSYILSY